MKSIFDELRSLTQSRSSNEAEVKCLVKMNSLYRIGAITYNELRIGFGGQSIGVAGDRPQQI